MWKDRSVHGRCFANFVHHQRSNTTVLSAGTGSTGCAGGDGMKAAVPSPAGVTGQTGSAFL